MSIHLYSCKASWTLPVTVKCITEHQARKAWYVGAALPPLTKSDRRC